LERGGRECGVDLPAGAGLLLHESSASRLATGGLLGGDDVQQPADEARAGEEGLRRRISQGKDVKAER
jgi:hypothetical protein